MVRGRNPSNWKFSGPRLYVFWYSSFQGVVNLCPEQCLKIFFWAFVYWGLGVIPVWEGLALSFHHVCSGIKLRLPSLVTSPLSVLIVKSHISYLNKSVPKKLHHKLLFSLLGIKILNLGFLSMLSMYPRPCVPQASTPPTELISPALKTGPLRSSYTSWAVLIICSF